MGSAVSEKEVIEATGDLPVTRARLVADLLRLGVRPGMTVLVHSSLSRLGWVVGGAETVIRALEHAVGPAGTLVMPAFSNGVPEPSRWVDPPVPPAWWEVIREDWPAFDPELTPTRGLGVVPEVFRHQPGVLRSHHPHSSFCARGPEAHFITHHHHLDYGLGARSPLDRIYDLDGKVLLLGVDHGVNSSLHLAEFRARWKGRERTVRFEGRVVRHGSAARVKFEDLEGTDADFGALGEDFERETGKVSVGSVGYGESRLMDQRALVDYAFEWFPLHRGPEEARREAREVEEGPSRPRYQMRAPPAAFQEEGEWHKARRRAQASRVRRH